MRSLTSLIRKHRTLSIVAGSILAVILLTLAFGGGSGNGSETVTAAKKDLVKTVKVSGKVAAKDDAALGFEVGGTVSRVYKKVGDPVYAGETLVALDGAGINANFLKAKAELSSAEAELVRLQGSAQFEAKTQNAKSSADQAIDEAFSEVDDAIRNKTDQFFKNPRTANPEIINAFDDNFNLKTSINSQRIVIEEVIGKWESARPDIATARKYIATVSAFLNDVSRAVNAFEPNSSLSQSGIDKYKADVAAARQNVNLASSKLLAADDTLSQSLSDVPVQQSRVDAARATVQSYQSDLSRTVIVSPIAGVVSKQDAKVGQAVSPNVSLVSVISKDYKIDAYVPEVSIAGIALGNSAVVTLDAYGSLVPFNAKVSHIDPAETIRDGVSNYKIELSFDSADERIKSGMTANVSIETLRTTDALAVPLRAVLSKDGEKVVFVKVDGQDAVERTVELGATDSEGNVQVVSGLEVGETILLNPISTK